jgi:BASS family bile acid:Na+ symporter
LASTYYSATFFVGERMDSDRIVSLLTSASLIAIMVSMGLKVSLTEVWSSLRQWRVLVLGLIANFVLVPAATLSLLRLFGAGPLVSIGFFILAVSPGAPVGPPVTAIARGNVPFAVALMIVLSVLSAFLSPALLSMFAPWIAPTSDLHVDYLAIVKTLLVMQLAPLAVGLALNRWAPNLGKRIAGPVGWIANVLLIALIVAIVVTQFDLLAAIRLRAWAGMTVLLIVSFAIGWLCGGSNRDSRAAMAVTTASRNVAVGLLIAGKNLPDSPALVAVVAFGLYCIVGTLAFAMLIRRASVPH